MDHSDCLAVLRVARHIYFVTHINRRAGYDRMDAGGRVMQEQLPSDSVPT